MKTKKRQKLCYNCEGEVDLDVIVCPFCAADLRVERPEVQRPAYDPTVSLKNLSTHQSLYPPQFSQQNEEEEKIEESEPIQETEEYFSEQKEDEKGVVGPIILLTLGTQLFILGLLMLFFSHEGTVVLKWDARFWFFYVLASIPLSVFGIRSVSKF